MPIGGGNGGGSGGGSHVGGSRGQLMLSNAPNFTMPGGDGGGGHVGFPAGDENFFGDGESGGIPLNPLGRKIPAGRAGGSHAANNEMHIVPVPIGAEFLKGTFGAAFDVGEKQSELLNSGWTPEQVKNARDLAQQVQLSTPASSIGGVLSKPGTDEVDPERLGDFIRKVVIATDITSGRVDAGKMSQNARTGGAALAMMDEKEYFGANLALIEGRGWAGRYPARCLIRRSRRITGHTLWRRSRASSGAVCARRCTFTPGTGDTVTQAIDPIIRLPDVLKATGLARSTIYGMLKAKPPTFQRQMQLSPRCVGWRESEIIGWIAARKPVVTVA